MDDAASSDEVVTLRDGTRVRIRPVCAEDKSILARGLAAMSPRSRYQRFFSDKPSLTGAELDYLTALDGDRHFALGAMRDAPPYDGLGIARFIRLPDDPTTAESAIAIVDAVQGRGLGLALMERLLRAAAERGISRLRNEFLAENIAFAGLMRRLAPGITFEADGPVRVAHLPVPPL